MIAREAVFRRIFSRKGDDIADFSDIGERERRAGSLHRHQVLGQLIDNDGSQQHHQADDNHPAASGALFFKPEAQHQAAHRQQRTGVKRAVVDNRQQPGVSGVDADQVVKEIENRRVQRSPETMVNRKIP